MFRDDYEELPYFDELGNQYVGEILQQDAYIRRGGRLSPPQMIKYENRVSMLVERLVLILDAVQEDPDAVRDYLHSIEQNQRVGRLPRQVYVKFKERIQKANEERAFRSERERDRRRVVGDRIATEDSGLSDLSVDQLLEMHRQRTISSQNLFEQFQKREKAGIKLQRMDQNLWSRYRGWVAENRRRRR